VEHVDEIVSKKDYHDQEFLFFLFVNATIEEEDRHD
jgi:hypothetical protein